MPPLTISMIMSLNHTIFLPWSIGSPATPYHFVVLASSIGAAVAASLCCILPVAAALLGLTSFAVASPFEKWRPYLLVLTGALFGGGFVLYYRDSKRPCAPGSACASKPMGRWSLLGLGIITVTVAGLAAFSYYSGHIIQAVFASSEPKHPKATSTATVAFLIEGMTCKECATGLQATLERLPGVAKTAVDYESHKATITFDPSIQDRKTVTKEISDSGLQRERLSDVPSSHRLFMLSLVCWA